MNIMIWIVRITFAALISTFMVADIVADFIPSKPAIKEKVRVYLLTISIYTCGIGLTILLCAFAWAVIKEIVWPILVAVGTFLFGWIPLTATALIVALLIIIIILLILIILKKS